MGSVINNSLTRDIAVPVISRQINALRNVQVGRHGINFRALRIAHHICTRVVHWYVKELGMKYMERSDALAVAYSLGIYLLNLFLAFISPKFDPSLEQDTDMEDGVGAGQQSSLPTKNDQEFKPFVRRLPEFKFWHSATRAVTLAFLCSWSQVFNLPVFWPVLVVYWLILVFLTMRRQIQSMIKYRYFLVQSVGLCVR